MSNENALIAEILAELQRARSKFPGDNVTTLAMAEEAGELATAAFEEPRDAVRKEAVQTAVMAMRIVLDGDATLRLWRASRDLDPLVEGEQLSGAELIALERTRQIEKEGWTPEHDESWKSGEIAGAAACYAMLDLNISTNVDERVRLLIRDLWPWAKDWWKPKDQIRNLTRSGALIAAEIDRLVRIENAALSKEGTL